MTTEKPVPLSAGARRFLRLIERDADADGWCRVSRVLFDTVRAELPPALADMERHDDGSGRTRLTPKGQSIIDAMPYLS